MIIVRDIEEVRYLVRMARFINSPRWSPRELHLLRLYRHLPDVEIAEIVGRNVAAVKNKRRAIGLLKYRRREWTPQEVALLRATAPGGMAACCRALPHREREVIRRKAKRLRVPIGRRVCHRARHPILEQIRRRAREDGISLSAIDREIGASNYFSMSFRHTAINWGHVIAAVDFFGGVIVNGQIDWMDY